MDGPSPTLINFNRVRRRHVPSVNLFTIAECRKSSTKRSTPSTAALTISRREIVEDAVGVAVVPRPHPPVSTLAYNVSCHVVRRAATWTASTANMTCRGLVADSALDVGTRPVQQLCPSQHNKICGSMCIVFTAAFGGSGKLTLDRLTRAFSVISKARIVAVTPQQRHQRLFQTKSE